MSDDSLIADWLHYAGAAKDLDEQPPKPPISPVPAIQQQATEKPRLRKSSSGVSRTLARGRKPAAKTIPNKTISEKR